MAGPQYGTELTQGNQTAQSISAQCTVRLIEKMEETKPEARPIAETTNLAIASARDGRLIERCRTGDREAFRSLYELYSDRVYSVALYFSGDEGSAKDITQDIFLKLFTEIKKFHGDAMFQTWLYRIVVNACMDDHRKRKRFTTIEMASEVKIMGSEQSCEKEYLRAEISNSVREAVARLKPKLRLPVLLRYIDGLSYAEIAAVLGCSAGTVASRLNRAHRTLARKLGHLADMTEPGQ